jgi:hypothetical protein
VSLTSCWPDSPRWNPAVLDGCVHGTCLLIPSAAEPDVSATDSVAADVLLVAVAPDAAPARLSRLVAALKAC